MKHPLTWIPTLYFAEALPNVMIVTVSLIMYQSMGLDNDAATFYTSLLYLPWVIKPLWSPVVEMHYTSRWWTVAMQLLLGIGMGAVALALELPWWLAGTLTGFYVMAFASATHDIAADGLYMQALDSGNQALYVGWRSTFYKGGTLFGSSCLVWMAGWIERKSGNAIISWQLVFAATALLFAALCLWHHYTLPRPHVEKRQDGNKLHTLIKSFFNKPHIGIALAFILLYRLPEALLCKVSPLFLLDEGAMGMTKEQLASTQGLWGTIGLLAGGILGGSLVARYGLKRCLWWMVAAITLPDAVYVWLAYHTDASLSVVATLITIEQFGYGFGFTAYMVYLMLFSTGQHPTAHYAFCTGLMAAGLMLPGMVAGYLQETLGYQHFFILVMSLCLVTVAVAALLNIDPQYGKKTK